MLPRLLGPPQNGSTTRAGNGSWLASLSVPWLVSSLIADYEYDFFFITPLKEIAVRCIQRNVKAFLGVRDWPWWRLLVRVTPLLNVHRTEEQLKSTIEEMQSLRSKLEKLESERNTLKLDNEKLENKVSMAMGNCCACI